MSCLYEFTKPNFCIERDVRLGTSDYRCLKSLVSSWGVRCVLVRDLTDAMYNPQKAPYVSHERGTELVVEYIEKYWCPSILREDLIRIKKSL